VSDEGIAANEPADKEPSGEEPANGKSTDKDTANKKPTTDLPVYDSPSSVPDVAVGTVLIYAGDQIPDGFLLCDGREVPRGKYQSLYNVIGEKYGAGDGVTTFNLPDMNTLATSGIAGTVAAGNVANTVSATNRRGIPLAGSTYIPTTATSQVSGASSTIAAEFMLARVDARPALKISEPTGPPPVVDPNKSKLYDDETKPKSNPTAKGDTPAMCFIIKY
jgi:microcystin-dependent protein